MSAAASHRADARFLSSGCVCDARELQLMLRALRSPRGYRGRPQASSTVLRFVEGVLWFADSTCLDLLALLGTVYGCGCVSRCSGCHCGLAGRMRTRSLADQNAAYKCIGYDRI